MNRTYETHSKEGGARRLVEDWLREHVSWRHSIEPSRDRDTLAELPQHSAWERLALVRQVLDDRPELERAVGRLSVEDQLKLTLEVLHGTASPHRQHRADPSPVPCPSLRSELPSVPVCLSDRTNWCHRPSRRRVRSRYRR
jgi:hypothetical protein